jgi:chorismate dehydratase
MYLCCMNFDMEEGKKKIKIGAVSYLNTKPLVFGFKKGLMENEVELRYDYPGKIAQALIENTIDIGLVPVAIIPLLKEHHIITNYCIAADGPVASVCLFSEVPIEKITTVLLDYQSRTSVMLVQYLFKEHWKLNPVFKEAGINFIDDIKDTTAAVVIGDRAFKQRSVSPFVYDLGEAWKAHTGLPFVFATWVSNKPLPALFIKAFNETNEYGLQRLSEVIAENPYEEFDLEKYYTSHIQYRLDEPKRKGLQKFLDYCSQIRQSSQPV